MKKYNIVLIRALACIAVILYHMNNMMFGMAEQRVHCLR